MNQQFRSPQDAQREQAATGANLVAWSRLLALGGLLTMLGGCGAAMGLHHGVFAGIGFALGFVLLIVGAILGQVGRAYQGRVI